MAITSQDHVAFRGIELDDGRMVPFEYDLNLPGVEPLFEAMKRGAKERIGKTQKEAVERFNRLVYWLKHAEFVTFSRQDYSKFLSRRRPSGA